MTGRKQTSNLDFVDDENPEWTEEDFARAELKIGDRVVGKAEFKKAWEKALRAGRPKSDNPKKAVSLRLDADVVEHFRAGGPGWQTRINDALRRAARLPKPGQTDGTSVRRAAAARRTSKKARSA